MESPEWPGFSCLQRKLFGIILVWIFQSVLYSQSPDPSRSVEKYRPGQQYEIKLRFQKLWNDFAVFYDDNHQLYYVRYRLDRWDYSNDAIVKDFHASVEYNVNFKFGGSTATEEDVLSRSGSKAIIKNDRKIRTVRNIHYGNYLDHRNSQVDFIRY